MEISNPLGSWGSNPQPLGNLTEGVEALQKAEIEKQIGEIAQTKKNIREDELWLLSQTPEFVDGLRTSSIGRIQDKTNELTNKMVEIQKQYKGHPLPLDAKIQVSNLMREVNSVVADEQQFIKGVQPLLSRIPITRKEFKYDSQRRDFDQKVGQFIKDVQDPNKKVSLLDAANMFQVEDRPPNALFLDVDNEIQKKIAQGRLPAKEGEWTPRDIEAITKSVRETVSGYGNDLLLDGRESGSFLNAEDATQFFIDRNLPSVRQYYNRKSSDGTGAGKRKPMQTYYSPAIRAITGQEVWSDGQEGVKADWTQPPLKNIPFKRAGERDVASGDFTPAQIMKDGWVEGSVKSTRKKTRTWNVSDVPDPTKLSEQVPEGATITGGLRGDRGQEIIKATWNEPVDETVAVPYTEIRGLVKDILPAWEEFYVNKAEKDGSKDYRRTKEMQKPSYKYGYPEDKEAAITNMQQEMAKEKPASKSIPQYTREYLKSQGYSDAKIDKAVKDKIIKLK